MKKIFLKKSELILKYCYNGTWYESYYDKLVITYINTGMDSEYLNPVGLKHG